MLINDGFCVGCILLRHENIEHGLTIVGCGHISKFLVDEPSRPVIEVLPFLLSDGESDFHE